LHQEGDPNKKSNRSSKSCQNKKIKMKSIQSTAKTVTFRILRYKPNRIDPPRYQNFFLQVEPDMSVLDALEKICLEQDNTLMYRHSCHHSSCGTCACKINGRERLTCITKISDLEEDTITLAPLEGFKPMGDLVVDMQRFYEDYSEDWRYLRRSERIKSTGRPAGISHFSRFENCIECGACISACPVTRDSNTFLGPAVLAAVNNELKKSPQKSADLLSLAGSKRGERLCQRAVNCSRVCPAKVYPARHIADLRRILEKRDLKKTAF
jgi:succinate dehydrogenase / fumarate reductase iron-sulfur subunit